MGEQGEELAKRNFDNILTKIGRKYEILHARWFDDKKFEVKFRTFSAKEHEKDYNAFCDEWVKDFSEVSGTIWVDKTSNTGPKVKFRKQYQCWTHKDEKICKELLFDPQKCKGCIDIKVLANDDSSKKKMRHLKLGLNVLVIINFFHLHSVNTEEAFSYFVHNCASHDVPTPEIPQNDRLTERVHEVIRKGPIISQKAAERAEEVLRKSGMQPLIRKGDHPSSYSVQQTLPSIRIMSDIPIDSNILVENVNVQLMQGYSDIDASTENSQIVLNHTNSSDASTCVSQENNQFIINVTYVTSAEAQDISEHMELPTC